jgi:hypothetical protein
VVTADDELWFDEELPLEVEAEAEVEVEELSSLDVALAVVAVSDWPEPVWLASVVAVPPSDPLAAIVPNAMANVASAAATTRRRMAEIRRARARRRSRTRSASEAGGGVEGMRAS